MVSSAANAAKRYSGSFYSAGSSAGSGFASGIRSKIASVISAVVSMASSAVNKLKSYLNINSPSKVFRKIGKSVPEGFAMGIEMLSGMVEKSSTKMGDTAIKSTSKTLARLGGVLLDGVDAEPTIRPVVDLSNVRSGANAINNLLGGTRSVRTLSNINAINSSMGSRTQNGDVVSAINKLSKDLGNINSSTYNINGIEFSEGSDVSEAFKTIIRAARIERRM